jgi:hypothetical protein
MKPEPDQAQKNQARPTSNLMAVENTLTVYLISKLIRHIP